MAAQLTIPAYIKNLDGGGTITYKGSPTRAIWWELVGVDSNVEGAAYGTITHAQPFTDTEGYATVSYRAPSASPGANKSDRIKVYESVSI